MAMGTVSEITVSPPIALRKKNESGGVLDLPIVYR